MSVSLPIALVVAVAKNGVIGSKGDMPWKLSSDLKRFKRDTMGKPILMGRKTFQSIGRPLPGRLNIVISRGKFEADGTVHATSIDAGLFIAEGWAVENEADEICVIGGGQIYAEVIEKASRLYVTQVQTEPEGDTYFPEISGEYWELVHEESVERDEKDSADTIYKIYERRNSPA